MTVEQNPRPYDPLKPYRDALLTFVKTIEATGGLNAEGNPVADEDWIDLGDAYAEACEVLDRKPMIEVAEE